MKKNEKDAQHRLEMWQDRMAAADAAYSDKRERMDEREAIYRGREKLTKIIDGDKTQKSRIPWNITYELIEAQVDSQLPSPKVTPKRKEDEPLATLIEDFCRLKLDEQPGEVINDQMERTTPIHGGGLFHVEWDAGRDISVLSFVHPKQLTPQPGVTSDIEDMDWCGLALSATKSYIKNQFGIDVSEEAEEEPERRSAGDSDTAEDLVTWKIVYFRNAKGGIGKFSYVGDTIIEDYEDYQARQALKCAKCGQPKPAVWNNTLTILDAPTYDGSYPYGGSWEFNGDSYEGDSEPETRAHDGKHCPYCGSDRFVQSELEYEEIWAPFDITDDDGNVLLHIEGERTVENEDGSYTQEPTKIPFYKPDIYPVILMRNVSSWGQLLGESDVDKIEPQQNAINRLNQKIMSQLLAGGSYISLPPDPSVKFDSDDAKELRLKNINDSEFLGVYTLQPDITQSLEFENQLYEQARNTLGVTRSFQGREDTTASSGKAKEISAAQAAGRFASKRVMKKYFWSRVFEALFKFELAYADDERPVIGRDSNGVSVDRTWSKWRFLRQDENGDYYWNTDFLFSVDTQNSLAGDRTTMWQETREYFLANAFGDRTQTATQILFWQLMEELHYPNAGEIKKKLIARQEREAKLQAEAARMQLEAQAKAEGRII